MTPNLHRNHIKGAQRGNSGPFNDATAYDGEVTHKRQIKSGLDMPESMPKRAN